MRPQNLKTKIFLDSGDPAETREALELLGFLDGQTTNPSLIARHPHTKARIERGEKFTREEIYDFYKKVVTDVSRLIPDGSVSVEVYADDTTTVEEMLKEGREMFSWIANAHIKYPMSVAGLDAAGKLLQEGGRVNITLCFSQEQAAAVYAATVGAARGAIFLSPFIGRLDDRGENGMDLLKNCIQMYERGDRHVEVLAASVRTLDHFLYSLALGADIITAPLSILKAWKEKELMVPGSDFVYGDGKALAPIGYRQLDLLREWHSFDLGHELTKKGLDRFAADWNALIETTT